MPAFPHTSMLPTPSLADASCPGDGSSSWRSRARPPPPPPSTPRQVLHKSRALRDRPLGRATLDVSGLQHGETRSYALPLSIQGSVNVRVMWQARAPPTTSSTPLLPPRPSTARALGDTAPRSAGGPARRAEPRAGADGGIWNLI